MALTKTDDGGFAASLAAAASAAGDEADADVTVAAPVGDSVEDDGAASSDGDPLDAAAADDPDADDGSAEASEDDGLLPDVGAIGQQFTDGDIKGACAALGIDPKVLGVNVPKLEAMRKGLKAAKDLEASASTKLAAATAAQTQAQTILTGAKAQYGFAVDLKQSIAAGDFYAVKELCEALAPKGTTWETIATGIVQAARGVSPSEALYRREVKRLKDEAAAREAAEAAAAEQATAGATAAEIQQRNVAGATVKLKGTEYDGIPEAAETLARIVAESYDAKRGGFQLTLPQALAKLKEDKIVAKLVRLAKLEKARTPAAEPSVPRAPSGQFTPRTRVVRTPNKADTAEARRAADFAKSIELATKAETAGRAPAPRGRR